jgi:hypothetical protein
MVRLENDFATIRRIATEQCGARRVAVVRFDTKHGHLPQPGDRTRYPTECVRPKQVQQFAETNLHKSIRNGSFLG